ncbi:hypothetical protein C2845_PM01G04550 [Panicum miliaceum]|uniref:non-specific serine/threonine protein kinase n=1 Tax=Panicum miliaceum TaxID=4540 RepID=A0A3L6TXW8_PANMI|nr:hypothetical protein C2845_PM01G04550 [Panicum miliaceum]
MLLNTGNNLDIVVMDSYGQRLWRSFNLPTDMVLPQQPMTRDTKLVSALARGYLYSGFYTHFFDITNMQSLIYNNGPKISTVYWPKPYCKAWAYNTATYNNSQNGILDLKGLFVASDKFEASDLDQEVMRRLTLDYDGNLRLYSLNATVAIGRSLGWHCT